MSENGVTMLTDIFPDQVVSEILTRLPSKSVCRFKSVSKRWLAIIEHRAFIAAYLAQNEPTSVKLENIIRISSSKSDPGSDPIRFVHDKDSDVYTLTVNPRQLLKPDEPLTDPNRKKIPITGYPQTKIQSSAEIIDVSNGLILFTLWIEPELSRNLRIFRTRIGSDPEGGPGTCFISAGLDALEDVLFVTNPVTREWARVPRPPPYLDHRRCFGFTADPITGEFVIGYYVYNLMGESTENASLTCFSSRTGKWVKKEDTGHVLKSVMGKRSWRPSRRFEFDGKMFWCDVSFGIVCWDEDPFVGAANEEKSAKSVFVTLPSGRVRTDLTWELMQTRCVDSASGWIKYMEVFEEGSCALEVWRLKDYRAKTVKWELVYKAERDALEYCIGGGFVIPSYPPSFPPSLYADYTKEKGNGCYKGKNFKEAIAWYSKSISVSPSAIAYGNRAMAYLKVGKYYEAEEDCINCLDLDDRYVKGYARRARARKELGDLNGALEDVKSALTLEPESEELNKQYGNLKRLLGMVRTLLSTLTKNVPSLFAFLKLGVRNCEDR